VTALDVRVEVSEVMGWRCQCLLPEFVSAMCYEPGSGVDGQAEQRTSYSIFQRQFITSRSSSWDMRSLFPCYVEDGGGVATWRVCSSKRRTRTPLDASA
jgi:hypothetical protein